MGNVFLYLLCMSTTRVQEYAILVKVDVNWFAWFTLIFVTVLSRQPTL